MGTALAILNVLLALGYPLAVYLGLTHFNARGVSLLLLLLLAPGLIRKLWRAPSEQLKAVAIVPASIVSLVLLSAVLDDARFVLALPVLINVALLVQFSASLRGTPMVERFARLQEPELSPEQVSYCRGVTQVWAGFFVVNGSVSLGFAVFGSVSAWALYNGVVSYVLMGVLGGCEYLLRKARFRKYGPGLHDRLIARIFPPPPSEQGSR